MDMISASSSDLPTSINNFRRRLNTLDQPSTYFLLSSSSIAAPLLHRCIVNLHRNLHKCIPSQACKRNDFLWRAVSNQRLTMVQTKNHAVNQETNPTNATIIPPKSSSSYSSSVSHRLRHRRYPVLRPLAYVSSPLSTSTEH